MRERSVEAHECERGVEVGVWKYMSGVEAYVCEGCGGACVREECGGT